MKIEQIKLTGEINKKTGMPYGYATIENEPGKFGKNIVVWIHTPDHDRKHVVDDADVDSEDIRSMAECLQEILDGYKGTNSEIHEYIKILNHFAN